LQDRDYAGGFEHKSLITTTVTGVNFAIPFERRTMNFCKLRLALYCSMTFFLALHAAAQSAPPIAPQTDASTVADEEQIISAARARANACASGDAQTWAMFVDANFRDIEGNAPPHENRLWMSVRRRHA
jgi:hypothetical protein